MQYFLTKGSRRLLVTALWLLTMQVHTFDCYPEKQVGNSLPKGVTIKAFANDQHHSSNNSSPQDIIEEPSLIDAVKFMKKFGYIPAGDQTADYIFSSNSLKERLKLVQKFGALPETGELDDATVKLMSTPRCGVHDVDPAEGFGRKKRFILGSKGWNKRKLTYHVANWTPKLRDKSAVQRELKKAFKEWSKYSHLQFTEVHTNEADIIIYFASYHHADRYPFDGQGGTLAHAYYPYDFGGLGGDIHFDDSEQWTILNPQTKDDEGLDFFTVAVHEIGHALGLAHSTVPSSIMFPYYKGYEPSFALDYDDVIGMWELYIKRKLDGDDEYFKTTTTTTPSTPSIDGTQNDEGSSTTDEGNQSENDRNEEETRRKRERRRREEEERRRVEERRKVEERRRREERRREEEERRRERDERREEEERRRKEWANSQTTESPSQDPVPDICQGDFDAVAMIRNEMFIFKGKYLWRYKHRRSLIPGYPSAINNMFPDFPKWIQKIDAVYERRNDSCIIFFVGKYYYEHNGNRLRSGGPHPLTNLGIPEAVTELDAVFHWPKNDKTYFFRKNLYWRRNDFDDRMDTNYPKDIKKWNGIPSDLTAATTYLTGDTFFFKKNQVWKYDNDLVRPATGYPKDSMIEWTGC